MKAIYCTAYGSPDVLKLVDAPKPAPKDNDVLVRVRAAVVGPADCAFRKGKPFIVKLMFGLRKPKNPILGVEFAGEVEAVGSAVTRFKPGDRVYGLSGKFGAHAEYMCIRESETMTHLTPRMTYEDAVGIADGLLTALVFLRDKAKLQRGQRILINGASGSVGAYAVQLAKHYGAHVTGVCSTRNVEMVKWLGADAVIDYTTQDFTTTGETCDVIFDAIGKSSFGRSKRALKPKGLYMTTVPSLHIVRDALRTSLSGGKKAIFTAAGLQQKTENLIFLNELFDAGAVRSVLDRCYPLAQVPDAHRYVDTERKKGNVVILVD